MLLTNKIEAKPVVKAVAIVGGSGAGKTFLADKLKMEFGERAGVIRLDNFYKDLSHLEISEREKVNFDDPLAIDWGEFRSVVETVLAGQDTLLPIYDFCSHTRKRERTIFKIKPIVIFEGLWLIHEPSLRRLFDFSVFVESREEIRLNRRIERDVSERGRTEESVVAQFKAHVLPMHEKFVQPQKQFADYAIESPWTEEEWLKLKKLVEERLGFPLVI